jgi:phage baseplate assembly protein W
MRFQDAPMNAAIPRDIEVREAIQTYEPRATCSRSIFPKTAKAF